MPVESQDLMDEFLLESRERVGRLEECLLALGDASAPQAEDVLEKIRRELHTLKGNAGLVGLAGMQSLAHAMEDAVDRLEWTDAAAVQDLLRDVDRLRGFLATVDGQPADTASGEARAGVRLGFAQLDRLVDLVGEMVIFRNRLDDALCAGLPALAQEPREAIGRASEELSSTLNRLQEEILRLRVIPLGTLFRSLQRIVHDESGRVGKQAELETAGGETPLDRALLEVASDALGHLVRNAVVHGLEESTVRRWRGKAAAGHIRIAAATAGQEVRIDVADDGGGIDAGELRAAARRLGIALRVDESPLPLIFQPGFSTRPDADLSAGRGIGLSAVQEAVMRQGGRVEIYTEPGAGTLFRLRLPLTVSIARALLVGSDGETYALPLAAVVESLVLGAGDVHEINGAGVVHWRGEVLPLLDLGYCFGTAPVRRRQGYAVILAAEEGRRGLLVDELQGIREVVVKPLDELAGHPPGVSGSTVLGDGRAALILDAAGLVSLSPWADGRRVA
jgi:two-component system, chemotaxis family, sensor kinase CheA